MQPGNGPCWPQHVTWYRASNATELQVPSSTVVFPLTRTIAYVFWSAKADRQAVRHRHSDVSLNQFNTICAGRLKQASKQMRHQLFESDRSQVQGLITVQGLLWGSVCIRFSSVAICTLQHATTEEEADPGTAMNLGSLLSRPWSSICIVMQLSFSLLC